MTTHEPIPEPTSDPTSDPSASRRRHLRAVDGRPAKPLTLRDETDLLALIPYTFGFHPHDSLVMMLLGDHGRPMFARVDVPSCAEESDAACAELVHAAVVNGGGRVVLVAYTDDVGAAYLAADQTARALADVGFELLLGLRADGERWWPLLPEPGLDEGMPYDLACHPITASGVLEGRVTHRSREQLADSLLPVDPERLEAVAAAHEALVPLPTDPAGLRDEARWLAERVRDLTEQGGVRHVSATELARMLRALADVELRDVAWAAMTRRRAEQHVVLWTDVVVQCPHELLAPAAGLLAFAAWLAGHGALAWCAIDRALQSDPDHNLARLVAQALDGAVPPSTWQPLDPSRLRVLSG
jgi:hypothetical protein